MSARILLQMPSVKLENECLLKYFRSLGKYVWKIFKYYVNSTFIKQKLASSCFKNSKQKDKIRQNFEQNFTEGFNMEF